MRIAAFSLNSSRTAFAKRKQEAQVERLTTQFKHANAILITNAVWWRGAALVVAASQSCVNDAAHAGAKTFLKSHKFFYHSVEIDCLMYFGPK